MRGLIPFLLFAFVICPAHAQSRSLFIEDLTWTEVRDAIATGKDTAIIYAGGTEQNGPHMALGKHNFIARHVAQAVAASLGNALVYPVLPFAPAGEPVARTDHMRFPGTISVSETTFAAVAREVAQSAIAAGFRNIALMGDHGGGQEALARVSRELTAEWSTKGVRVHYIADAYSRSHELVTLYLSKRNLTPGAHAGLSDTSELMAIDSGRRWIRRDKLSPGSSGNGVDGDPRLASPELGRRFLQFKVDSATAQIRALVAQAR
jgi:creatinine amidohydrolase